MVHAVEGSLQEYLDGEMDGAAVAALDRHLAVCAACVHELDLLRSASAGVHASLSLLTAPAPTLAARAAVAAGRRGSRRFALVGGMTSRGFMKAAMLLLMLGSAAAAAIPGSPLRRAVESAVARVVQMFGGGPDTPVAVTPLPTAPAAVPAVPETVHRASAFMPSDGEVRVLLHTGASAVDVIVRMADDPRAQIATAAEAGDVAFRFASGSVEVSGLEKGSVTIEIPRSVRSGSVLVDGAARVVVEDGGLQLAEQTAGAPTQELRFRIGG